MRISIITYEDQHQDLRSAYLRNLLAKLSTIMRTKPSTLTSHKPHPHKPSKCVEP